MAKAPSTSKKNTEPKIAAGRYVSTDMAMLLQPMPAEQRVALEKMYATSHMAIPKLPAKA